MPSYTLLLTSLLRVATYRKSNHTGDCKRGSVSVALASACYSVGIRLTISFLNFISPRPSSKT